MVTGGRLGDLFGYRRLFMIGVVAFVVASLLCGVAQTSAELVALRLVQGLTGAVMVPQVVALITAAFPPRERSRALAWYGATMGFGFVSGQILGGGLIQSNVLGLGWRAIFLVNVPGRHHRRDGGVVRRPARRRAAGGPGSTRWARWASPASLALALVPLTLGRDEGWPLWTWVSHGGGAARAGAHPGLGAPADQARR